MILAVEFVLAVVVAELVVVSSWSSLPPLRLVGLQEALGSVWVLG